MRPAYPHRAGKNREKVAGYPKAWKYGDPVAAGQCCWCGSKETPAPQAPGEYPACPGCGGI